MVLSLTRPRRESAAATTAAIQASLQEESKAKGSIDADADEEPDSKAAGKRKAAPPVSSGKVKAPKTPANEYAVLKSGLPKSSKAALAKADAADLAAIRAADLKKALNAHGEHRKGRERALPHGRA